MQTDIPHAPPMKYLTEQEIADALKAVESHKAAHATVPVLVEPAHPAPCGYPADPCCCCDVSSPLRGNPAAYPEPWMGSYGARVGRDTANTTTLVFLKVAGQEFQLYEHEARHLRDLLVDALGAPEPAFDFADAIPTQPGDDLIATVREARS